MENKEVEKSLSNINGGIFSVEDIQHIREYIEQLEFKIEELHWCINRNEKSHLFFTDNQVKIIKQLEQEDKDLSDCIRDLEKALDKACEQLVKLDYCVNNPDCIHTISWIEWNCNDWKEWCMKHE